jgi:hypothetical protein
MSQDALDLLLNGVKDQGQRKQNTSAYYAFASGDPETFAVQFAVILRAHASALKSLPVRLEKALVTETRKLGDVVIAHQRSVERFASLIGQEMEKCEVGEGSDAYAKTRQAIENKLASHAEIVRSEREKIVSAVAANGQLLQRVVGQRILLGLTLSYLAGVLSVLAFHHLWPMRL